MAVFDRLLALWELLFARYRRRALSFDGGAALVLVDGALPPEASERCSLPRLVISVAVGALFFWVLPVAAALAVLFVAGSWLRSFGVPREFVGLGQGILIMLWALATVTRLFIWGFRTSMTATDRLAARINWLAPTVRAAVSSRHRSEQWLVSALPLRALDLQVPFTVNPARLVGDNRVEQALEQSSWWAAIEGDGGTQAPLFITNPSNKRARTTVAIEQRKDQGLATAVRVGLIVIAAYLFAGVLGGYLAWQADVNFSRDGSAQSPTLGSVWDSLYWGLSMMTGFGDERPSSVAGTVVAVVLQLGSLILTAALIAAVFNALTERSQRSAEQQESADLAALERAGLLEPVSQEVSPSRWRIPPWLRQLFDK